MKKSGVRWWLRSDYELNAFIEHVRKEWQAGKYPTVEFLEKDRTTDQNAYIYALYRELAAAIEDKSVIEVKRECKLRFGVVIRKGADPEWAEWYDNAIKPMSYEQKLYLMDAYPVTSEFTKAQASTYIDSIIESYAAHGIHLKDPRT